MECSLRPNQWGVYCTMAAGVIWTWVGNRWLPELSRLARLLAKAFGDIDRDVRRASEGSLDLGTLATLGFFGAGAANIFASREIPLPPWFNLAWWGYRTFMTNEQDEIQSADGVEVDPG